MGNVVIQTNELPENKENIAEYNFKTSKVCLEVLCESLAFHFTSDSMDGEVT